MSAAWRRGLRWLLTPIAGSQRCFDLWHGIFGLIGASIAAFMGAVWWLAGLGFSLYFVWGWNFPTNLFIPGEIVWAMGSIPHTFIFVGFVTTIVGLLLLVSAPFATSGLTAMNVAIARVMLTTERVSALQHQIEELTDRRGAAVAAGAAGPRQLGREIRHRPPPRVLRPRGRLVISPRPPRRGPPSAPPPR